ncbi:MAG: M36 family metallopeptidase [Candidatus Sumerlaeaceae bacterium]|nr:M36 family metallopeptidase [Candidatus Sumerlaeaceae bacterium]
MSGRKVTTPVAQGAAGCVRMGWILPVFAVIMGSLAGSALAVVKADEHGGLPNVDVRYDTSAASAATKARLSQGAVKARETLATIQGGISKLSSTVPGVKVTTNEILGSPSGLSSDRGHLTGQNPGVAAGKVVNDFVAKHSEAFGIRSGAAGEQLTVGIDADNPDNKVRFVVLQQAVAGIPVFQGELRGLVTPEGELVSLVADLAAGLEEKTLQSGGPGLTAQQAVEAAAKHCGMDVDARKLVTKARASRPDALDFEASGDASLISARQVLFPTAPGDAVLAFEVVVSGPEGSYLAVVDASTGDLLCRKNLRSHQTQSSTYMFYDTDSPAPGTPWPVPPAPTPNTGLGPQAPPINQVPVTMTFKSSADPTFSYYTNIDPVKHPQGWIVDTQFSSRGNNVWAGRDQFSPDGIDADPFNPGAFSMSYGTASGPSPSKRNFMDVIAPAPLGGYQPINQPPATSNEPYDTATVTNMFVWCNRYHDRLYDLGFTERARNFQATNFNRGGGDNDAVLAQAQDYSGTDNANFATPPDGMSGIMQMYIFPDPAAADRDGALDVQVMLHELTHGLSNRLIANGTGLFFTQGGGMGEGWSDFYALALLSDYPSTRTEALRDPDLIYPNGGWVTKALGSALLNGMDNYYYGIRRYPYSTNLKVSPLTFGDIDPRTLYQTYYKVNPDTPESPFCWSENGVTEVHNLGEIWSSMLWQVRANVMKRFQDVNTTLGNPLPNPLQLGNQHMLQIVTDALKITQTNPTFIDGRDAVFNAIFAQPNQVLPTTANDPVNVSSIARDEVAAWRGFADRGLGYSAVAPGSAEDPESGNFYVQTEPINTYTCKVSSGPVYSGTSTTLFTSDMIDKNDGTQPVVLPYPIVFYGATYTTIFVGTNGYITFGGGDTLPDSTLAHHFEKPRVSALLADFDISTSGSISWVDLGDRVAIIWDKVLEAGTEKENTFMIELGNAAGTSSGLINITFGDMATLTGITGLSNGGGVPVGFVESNLSDYPNCQPKSNPSTHDYFTEQFESDDFDLAGKSLDFNIVFMPAWAKQPVPANDWPVELLTPIIESTSSGDLFVLPDSTVNFSVPVENKLKKATLSTVRGVYQCTAPGVTVDTADGVYADIPPGQVVRNNIIPSWNYIMTIDPSVPCGVEIPITVGIVCDQNGLFDPVGGDPQFGTRRLIKKKTFKFVVGGPDYGAFSNFAWPNPSPFASVRTAASPSATSILLTSTQAMRSGLLLQNASTNEIIQVNGYSDVQKLISVTRGAKGTTPAAMSVGDNLVFVGSLIPDGTSNGLVTEFQVDGVTTVGAIKVHINDLQHERLGDLVIQLTSPDGHTANIVDRVANGTGLNTSSAGFTNVTLTDDALDAIQSVSGNITSNKDYRAAVSFRDEFRDLPANGTWKLTVSDRYNQFTGILKSVSLDVAPSRDPCIGFSRLQQSNLASAPTGWSSQEYGDEGNQGAVYVPPGSGKPGRLVLSTNAANSVRVPSWITPGVPYLNYPNQVYRLQAYVARSGQADMNDQTQVPSLRLKLSTRAAQGNVAEYFFNTSPFNPGLAPAMAPNIPSSDPNNPTLYEVNFNPVDVPALLSPTPTTINGTIENYSLNPTEQGNLEIIQTSIDRYSAPPEGQGVLLRSFGPADFTQGTVTNANMGNPDPKSDSPNPRPKATIDGLGITLDSTAVPNDAVSYVAYDFVPPSGTEPAMQPGKQYRIRYHVSSNTPANNNPQMRLRARAIQFGYSNKFEIGSAAAASQANNLIAAQALPGIGTGNPDNNGIETNGGYYEQWIVPPPVLPSDPELKKIRFAFDLLDGFPGVDSKQLGVSGRFTLDSFEVREFNKIP